MKIILPKTLDNKAAKTDEPLFFLAGPVGGGGDWQAECCHEIKNHISDFYAVLPCRYPDNHPLMKFRVGGNEEHFDRQLTWERYYLDIAATSGCLIFWLPCESKENPRTGSDPYAMDTRGELGEWRGRMISDPKLRIVIGAEPDFPGLSQIQRNFNFATQSEYPIYDTLKETVKAAVQKVQ